MPADPPAPPSPSSPSPPHLFHRGEDGLLKREQFSPERLEALQADLARHGAGWKLLSHDEREETRRRTLEGHPQGEDLWIFGYGSLMWNPALHVSESRPAEVKGFERSFCLSMILGRGSPESPGLMLGLVEGDRCAGVVHRIDKDHVESETSILWMREMLSGVYVPTWVDASTPEGSVRAVTFTIDKTHPRFAEETLEEQANLIATAVGRAGSNRDYLYRCKRELERLGIADPYVDDLFDRVTAITGEPGDPLPFGGKM
ncbi:ChaC-like protein-domain-containing protein [Hyaloraphidium curvatum]|nr:ChaC-like protein-domain-containing protein [Hyaloraphidium curvatum]